MPETEYEFISKEWLQSELRTVSGTSSTSLRDDAKDLIILDCRSSNEFGECHIRSAVNFSIPSIMLRRLAAGKIDLLSTIKSPDLKKRIQNSYKVSLFVLYNEMGLQQPNSGNSNNSTDSLMLNSQSANVMDIITGGSGGSSLGSSPDSTIDVLHKRLKQDGCRVVALQGKFCLLFFSLFSL